MTNQTIDKTTKTTNTDAQPTLSDFIQGKPEAVLRATKKPKILITWLHADELLAPRVAHHIYTQRPDLAAHVDFICGNPMAAAHPDAIGFHESDLNRCFGIPHPPKTYEEKRAVEVLRIAQGYDYIIDLHTTNSDELGSCVFIPSHAAHKSAIKHLIAATPNQRIVAMPSHGFLIDVIDNGIALEYSATLAESEGLPAAIHTLEVATGLRSHKPKERQLYFVEGTIPKTQDPGPDAHDFELWQPGDYYPILLGNGPRAYRNDVTKDYCCFYAKRMEKIVL